MVDFGDPIDYKIFREVDRKHVVAHWRVDDFNVDYPSFSWGNDLETYLQYEILMVMGIGITVIEGAPIAVTVAPSIYTHSGDTRGVRLDWKDNAAGKSDLYWPSLSIPVDMSHIEGQLAGFVSAAGYAGTDDLELTITGVSIPNEIEMQQRNRARLQSGSAYSGIAPPMTGGGGAGQLPPK